MHQAIFQVVTRRGVLSALPALLVVLIGTSCTSTKPTPPIADVRPHAMTIHGDTRVDDYYWLKNRDSEDMLSYLRAENDYTQKIMAHTKRFQDTLYREMKGRMKETDLSVPTKEDDFLYYTRTEKGKQYSIHCRKRGGMDAAEEITLDENVLAAKEKYFRVGMFRVSPDHRLLAFSTDTNGSETYTLRVKNLETGEMLSDAIPNTYYGLEWGNDNKTLFYTTLDHAKRAYRLHRHTLGTDPAEDTLIHEEPDERYNVRISKTRSERFLLLRLESSITSEVRFLEADHPYSEFRTVHPRQQGMEYKLAHQGEHFYIVTNDEALNFKMMRAPVASPDKDHWEEVLAHRPSVKLDGVDAFADHLVIYERDQGLRRFRVRPMGGGTEHYVDFPEAAYAARASGNREFATDTLRFSYSSLVTPRSVFDYDVKTKERKLLKQQEVLGGYDPNLYQSERVFATAKDGAKIPLSIVYRKGVQRDGQSPTLLYAYGSYGYAIDPRFSSARLSLLDRGFVYALANIRGGGAMGRAWYEDGKFLNKKNTFTDFIACGEYLVREGYTSPERLAVMGGSAGGLLMGAVTNMRPDLFGAVVAKVPFVDVVTTMLDPSIPLTVTEYEEWGDPNDAMYYAYMKSYSPYDNVTAKAYPNLLITAGLNDPRVQYFEPAKWTAKLRANKTDDNVLLLKTHMGAGHGGSSGRYNRLRETAFEYAFIMDRLGVPLK